MDRLDLILLAIFLMIVGINIYVCFRLATADYLFKHQKLAQGVIVWILPVIGGLLIWLLQRSYSEEPKRRFENDPDRTEKGILLEMDVGSHHSHQ